jgi:hypothetical protein
VQSDFQVETFTFQTLCCTIFASDENNIAL